MAAPPSEPHSESCARHQAGLLDGSVFAVGKPYRLPMGGQRNFGGIGPDPGTLPSFGVNTSDGWQEQFHSEADALAFIARFGRKAVA